MGFILRYEIIKTLKFVGEDLPLPLPKALKSYIPSIDSGELSSGPEYPEFTFDFDF